MGIRLLGLAACAAAVGCSGYATSSGSGGGPPGSPGAVLFEAPRPTRKAAREILAMASKSMGLHSSEGWW